jgi:hypothetical protein
VADLATRRDVLGVLFFGSAARGEATPASDLDLYVITRHETRGSVGRLVADLPAEISFASLAQWTAHVREERPTVVNAFATGRSVLDRTQGEFASLRDEARTLWDRGPSAPSAANLLRFRFHLTDLVRDLEAMPEHSAATALLASAGIRLVLEAHCAIEGQWMPPLRHAVTVLRPQSPTLVAMIDQCAFNGFPRSLTQQAIRAVLQTLGGELDTYDTTPVSPR